MEPKLKKIPQRQCLGCNQHFNKSDLFRVVRSPEGEISLDLIGKKSGRGAYICSAECLRRCRKSRRIEKTLECDIPESVWEALESEAADRE